MNSLDDIKFLESVHKNAPLSLHTDILFGNLTLAGMPFRELYDRCMAQTQTKVGGWKVFRRTQRAFYLGRYLEYVATLPHAAKAECGVFRGFSALLACNIFSKLIPGFDGKDFYLCDSFEGLSKPVADDYVEVQAQDGTTKRYSTHDKGHFAVDIDSVTNKFDDYPNITFVQGWLPDSLAWLPDTQWSYLHIDVDLYEPTLGCLEYFLPRLVKGAVIVNDDFGSPLFPGGGKSWREFFSAHGLSYIVLDSGQSVYIHV